LPPARTSLFGNLFALSFNYIYPLVVSEFPSPSTKKLRSCSW
jgi:hypothetical protein